MLVIPALMLGVWLLGVAIVAWRGRGHGKSRLSREQQSAKAGVLPAAPVGLDDPRLSSLRHAADAWRQAVEPRRLVIDQVCLVPDVPSFLEAIAVWDERHFFPILIDEPIWVLPFLRAFRPARVVRYRGRAQTGAGSRAPTISPEPPASREAEWSSALEAVARAGSGPDPSDANGSFDGATPRRPGRPPPGLVLAAPDSPMLAGAVALAAGHLQPLVRLEPYAGALNAQGGPDGPRHFGDVLTLEEAWDFARRVEDQVAARVAHYRQLGDDCDFLTIAGDWPYRYTYDVGVGPARGLFAVDDLIGRRLEGGPNGYALSRSRRRWSYAGRLLGDPAASVARAMGALFLQPRSALLWNTYGGGDPRSDYTMGPAADLLTRALPGPGAVVHRAGRLAGLTSWHRTNDPVNRSGLVLINSSGEADYFTITGGPGRPGDVPRGVPAAVAMIHSFSAADPTNPETIGGRWLAQGAFVFFGSVNEPFLPAFRTPRLVAALLAAEVPLVAALRQGEFEAFGFPWRLVYLGDPLYRLEVATPMQRRPIPARPDSSRSDGSPSGGPRRSWLGTWWNTGDRVPNGESDRVGPSDWQTMAPAYADWPILEIAPPVAGPVPPPERRESDTEDDRLRWCLDAAIAESTRPGARGRPSHRGAGAGAMALSSNLRPVNWRSVLRQVLRDRLEQRLRPVFDDLLIDALGEIGAFDELQSRLAQLPPQECGPRVWLALETCAMDRLARLVQEKDPIQSFARALSLWDEVVRLSWPAGSPFPAQFTERVAALTAADAPRRLGAWLDRLRRTGQVMAAQPGRFPHAAVIAAEQARLEGRLDRH